MQALAASGEKGLVELMAVTHAGMTSDEFAKIVSDWLATARDPRFKRPYTELVYQPMLELLAYLRANGFKTFIVSGGGIEFMRPWTERVYGIPPEQVVGSSIKTRFEMRDGRPVLFRLPEINFIDDKAGKPVGINEHIGRRPIAAFGNSDGDLEMLQWTTMSGGRALRPDRPSHRRRTRIRLRPQVALRQARQGAGRRGRQQVDGGGHEEGLEARVRVPVMKRFQGRAMTPRGLLIGSLGTMAAALMLGVGAAQAQVADRKPNIVFMLADNLGYGELGAYGGGLLRGAPTPRIDTLANEGMRLLNFNVEAQCTPSRSALMTGRFSIRSGTYEVPIGGGPDGLTLWEVTIAELLSAQGYATGIWGKWHLGSSEARFPTNQGFDEWYGIPRTYDEAMWPSLNETKSMWPSVGNRQGWDAKIVHPEHIYDARKGEKPRQVAVLDVDRRRIMEAEITSRAVDFIKRNANAGKPFYAYVSFSLVHMPTLPNPEFAGKTGNGDWADCLAEMDHRVGQILNAIKEAGIEDNTVVVFASDNGPEATNPWQGDSGPWRGTYFTAMEGSLRAPFIVRWPGKVPAGRVNNEIVHIVDLYTTIARVGGAEVPKDRPITT